MEFIDRRQEAYWALAHELLEIQLGSAPDAKKMLEDAYPLNSDEIATIEAMIDLLVAHPGIIS